jgi:hypothetical protein
VAVRGVGLLHPRVRVRGRPAFGTLAIPAPGRVSASAAAVTAVHRRLHRTGNVTLAVALSRAGLARCESTEACG